MTELEKLKSIIAEKNLLITSIMQQNVNEIDILRKNQQESITTYENLFREQLNKNNKHFSVLRKELKNQLVNYIRMQNDLSKNKITILTKQLQESNEINVKYGSLFQEHELLKSNYESIKHVSDKYEMLEKWKRDKEINEIKFSEIIDKLVLEKQVLEVEVRKFQDVSSVIVENDILKRKVSSLIEDNLGKQCKIDELAITVTILQHKTSDYPVKIEQVSTAYHKIEELETEIVDLRSKNMRMTGEVNEMVNLKKQLLSQTANVEKMMELEKQCEILKKEDYIKDQKIVSLTEHVKSLTNTQWLIFREQDNQMETEKKVFTDIPQDSHKMTKTLELLESSKRTITSLSEENKKYQSVIQELNTGNTNLKTKLERALHDCTRLQNSEITYKNAIDLLQKELSQRR